MNLANDFWRDRRVLITGHTGFKGSWLSLWLEELGARVTGYALSPPTQPNLFDAAQIAKGIKNVIGDVRDYGRLRALFESTRPEFVFHLAAQPLVRASYQDPIETYSVNVLGTVTVLETVRTTGGVRVVVNVTSDKCYENREWLWGYRENEPMGGFDPYSSSKGCSELVTAAFRNSFFSPEGHEVHGVALASARAGNVIGGGDWADDRLVPDLVRAFASGRSALIRRPDAIRPWQHVLEPLYGYLMLARRLWSNGAAFAEAWNFGPDTDDTWAVRRVCERAAEFWGTDSRWRVDEAIQPHEAAALNLDSSKARARLGWRPRWTLSRALDATIRWYRAFHDGADARSLTLRQIREYTGQSNQCSSAHG